MDEKIEKLKAAADEAEAQVKVCKEALDTAAQQLATAKAKYKSLPIEQQNNLQVNDTELPELIETHVRAKNVYETAEARHATNLRYLAMMEEKRDKGSH